MSFAVTINARDGVSPALQKLADAIAPARLNKVIAQSAVNTYKEHLRGINSSRANQLGGARTNFYFQAARGTNYRIEPNGVVISINQVGIRQRYFGGVIKPKPGKKFLTIPAHPDAHGHRASEFPGLVLVFGHDEKPIALARPVFAQRKRGSIGPAKPIAGEILFRLVRSVTQRADPTLLPYPELVLARIEKDTTSFINRSTARSGGATP